MTDADSHSHLHGSCPCGGVVFRADRPVLGASHCYCTIGQKTRPTWVPHADA